MIPARDVVGRPGIVLEAVLPGERPPHHGEQIKILVYAVRAYGFRALGNVLVGDRLRDVPGGRDFGIPLLDPGGESGILQAVSSQRDVGRRPPVRRCEIEIEQPGDRQADRAHARVRIVEAGRHESRELRHGVAIAHARPDHGLLCQPFPRRFQVAGTGGSADDLAVGVPSGVIRAAAQHERPGSVRRASAFRFVSFHFVITPSLAKL